jgi:uncharacterized coiled-coil protein SlyX
MEGIENRVTNLENKMSSLEADVAVLKSTVDSTCKMLEKIDGKVDLIISKIADFQTELRIHRLDIDDLKAKVDSLTKSANINWLDVIKNHLVSTLLGAGVTFTLLEIFGLIH